MTFLCVYGVWMLFPSCGRDKLVVLCCISELLTPEGDLEGTALNRLPRGGGISGDIQTHQDTFLCNLL